MLSIDGSQGEGGGQIIRSSIALSMITGTPFTVFNIRARRAKPGLARQHVTAVQSAARLCQAKVDGATVGSSSLTFIPGEVQPGSYNFDIGSAGSTMLVLQTLLPALLHATGPTRLVLQGGTHNPLAPPFDFFRCTFAPLVEKMGARLSLQLESYGFYPAGGGRVVVDVTPAKLVGFDLLSRGEPQSHRVDVLLSRLPPHIAEREVQTIAALSGWNQDAFHIQNIQRSPGPGNVVMIQMQFENICELFVGFGQKGVRAEDVGARVWQEASEYLATDVPVGPHLADQWMLPLALSAMQGSGGTYRTMPLTGHSYTHLDVLQKFLPIQVQLHEEASQCVRIEIKP